MLTTSTPETVNPVSDACEAAGVPCISTVVPWEAWYFGRGGSRGHHRRSSSPTTSASAWSSSVAPIATSGPRSRPTRRSASCGRTTPTATRSGNALGPLLTKAGYTIVDPGAYTDGTNDYSSLIAKFKSEQCEIFNAFPLPPDFATFWQQAAQQSYKPKIAQIAKTGLFPRRSRRWAASASGSPGDATGHRPGRTLALTNVSAKELGDGYQSSSGKQWNQQLGPSLALFDAAAAALKATPNPKDKVALARTLASLEVDTPIGHLAWGKGPVGNVVATPIVGGQWVAAPAAASTSSSS